MSSRSYVARLWVALMLAASVAGCGANAHTRRATVSADIDPPAQPQGASPARAPAVSGLEPAVSNGSCAAKVMQVLQEVVKHVYREGVVSERTATAEHFITTSIPLREAVESGDATGARAAARAMIADGRMTSLRVSSGAGEPAAGRGRVLAEVGSPALAPISGTLTGSTGALIGSFLTSVWSDSGFVAESEGISQGLTSLRSEGRTIDGSFPLPAGQLARSGAIRLHGVAYRYTSFPASAYPSGEVSIYLLRRASSFAPLCGADDQATLVNTLARIATLIYQSEGGQRAFAQVRRVQRNAALLSAVARRDPAATRTAVEALLHQHVVRLRVSAGGQLLADVGGPYVLAPVSAPLRLHGRQIGTIVLSIQDDEGYKRLTGRLAGLRVLMYMGGQLIKNSLGPSPGSPPPSGSYRYRGHLFRVFTLHAQAFPQGPLRIVALIPIPYS